MSALEDLKSHMQSPYEPKIFELVTVIAAENVDGAGEPQLVTGFGSGWMTKCDGTSLIYLATTITAEVHLSWDDGGIIRHQTVGLWAIRPLPQS